MFERTRKIAPLMCAGLIAYAGVATAAHPHGEEEAKETKKEHNVFVTKKGGDKDQNVVIKKKDGSTQRVVINGKDVSTTVDVIHEDGHIIVLDEDGNILHEMDVPEAPRGFSFSFGEDDELTWNAAPFSDDDRPMIGVELNETDDGVFIVRVIEGSPAEKAGLKAHDVIVRAGGKNSGKIVELQKIIEAHEAGDDMNVIVLRDDDEREFEIKLAPRGKIMRVAPDDSNFGVFIDESRAHEMHERAEKLRHRAEAQTKKMKEFQWRVQEDDNVRHKIAIELKEKLHGLDEDQQRKIHEAMERAHKAMEELDFEFEFDMPEIEIHELDEDNNRIIVVPEGQGRNRVWRAAPRIHMKELHELGELKELENLHEHLQKIEGLEDLHLKLKKLDGLEDLHLHLGKLKELEQLHEHRELEFRGQGGNWDDSASRIERLEERVEKLEAMIEKMRRHMEERNS